MNRQKAIIMDRNEPCLIHGTEIKKTVARTARALDIGCGGNKKKGFLGVDISKGEDVDFVMNVCKLDFEDNTIEEVFSRRCIQHVEDDKKALSEIFRVLKPDGVFRLVVASWYGWLYYRLHLSNSCGNYKTFHLYRDSELRKMLEEVNFTIQSLRHIPSTRGMGYDIEAVCRKEIVQKPVRTARAVSVYE